MFDHPKYVFHCANRLSEKCQQYYRCPGSSKCKDYWPREGSCALVEEEMWKFQNKN